MTQGGEPEIRVTISSAEDIVVARQRGRALAAELGFSSSEATLLAAAISELARNIVTYAGSGEISLGRADGMLMVTAHDDGPGISDLNAAFRSGYSTSGGLGLGLPAVRRIADFFEIVSDSHGTTVTIGKAKR
jgi:serine/threonine-protein kinase RsbT